MKFLFLPLSLAGGLLAGLLGKRLFEGLWGLVDDEEPPDAEHKEIDYVKLVIALALEGAIFRVVKGFFDHGARHGFERLSGSWPGQAAPEPE
ncbi:MAG TPA: DUF4235 domain-containing protein [Solirubrobacterales bacterium]|jgi:hypothetical protein